jgi:flap endonuclease-1
MGIKQLSKVIGDNAPRAIIEHPLKNYFGRKVAIDASMSIYQFLIAVRSDTGVFTNSSGAQTSHLMGMFYRTLRLLENGIKPIYVFDGAPPEMKSAELAKRSEARASAAVNLADAKEVGAKGETDKFERRLVKVTPQHVKECQELLDCLGVPWINAPSEAEAQCAELVKGGLAFGVASEDMDTLTFGAPVMLRNVTVSEAKKLPIKEFRLDETLKGLGLTMDQFIDMCILLGCDYCETVKGVGPMRALSLVKQYSSIEAILSSLEVDKRPPEDWPYRKAREMFKQPQVTPASQVKFEWNPPNSEKITELLVNRHGFDVKRVNAALDRVVKAHNLGSQKRMDDFFKSVDVKNKENGHSTENGKKKTSPPTATESAKKKLKK